MSIFTLYHKDGTRQVVRGPNPEKAMILAEYGAGTACALAFWVEGDDSSHRWDHREETWVRENHTSGKTHQATSALCMASTLQECLGQMHRIMDKHGIDDSAFANALAAGEAALEAFESEIERARQA